MSKCDHKGHNQETTLIALGMVKLGDIPSFKCAICGAVFLSLDEVINTHKIIELEKAALANKVLTQKVLKLTEEINRSNRAVEEYKSWLDDIEEKNDELELLVSKQVKAIKSLSDLL